MRWRFGLAIFAASFFMGTFALEASAIQFRRPILKCAFKSRAVCCEPVAPAHNCSQPCVASVMPVPCDLSNQSSIVLDSCPRSPIELSSATLSPLPVIPSAPEVSASSSTVVPAVSPDTASSPNVSADVPPNASTPAMPPAKSPDPVSDSTALAMKADEDEAKKLAEEGKKRAEKKAEQERQAKMEGERKRLADEVEAKKKAAKEKAEQERLAKEKAKKEEAAIPKVPAADANKEKMTKEKADEQEANRSKKEKAAKQKAKKEPADNAKSKKPSDKKVTTEQEADEKAKADRLKKEAADKKAKQKAQEEKLAKEKAEAERVAKEKAEAERVAKEKAEAERVAKAKAEAERVAKAKAEAERIAFERANAKLFVDSIEVTKLKANGLQWDTDSSEPDLHVSIRHGDKVSVLTEKPNQVQANYDQDLGRISAGDEIVIEASDADIFAGDSIGKKSYKITEQDIDNHGFTLEFDSVKSMKFSIHP